MNDEERRLLDVDAIEADARQRTGRLHYGCIPAWAWRAAILARQPAPPPVTARPDVIEPPTIEPGRICGRCGYNPCQCHMGDSYSIRDVTPR